jgi:hypothetical protein
MSSNRLHVVTYESGWAVKREGKDSPESTHNTQREAIASAYDAADTDETDIIIHRQDGKIRRVVSAAEHNGSGVGTKKAAVQPQDLVSVGSRISWAAILAGAFVGLAVYVTCAVLASAVGLSVDGETTNRGLAILATVAVALTTLLTMFIGGYVASRTTAGETTTEAVIYGLVLWAALFVGFALLATAGISIGGNFDFAQDSQTVTVLSPEVVEEAKLSEDQVNAIQRDVENTDPAWVAWGTFLTILLSIGAAIFGALAGAGPYLQFVRRPATGQAAATVKT